MSVRSLRSPSARSPTGDSRRSDGVSPKRKSVRSPQGFKKSTKAALSSDETFMTGTGTDRQEDDTEGGRKGKKRLQQVSSADAGGLGHMIDEEPYYHGFMTPVECKPVLTQQGDFLVRKTELNNKMVYAISVCVAPGSANPVKHFVVKRTRSKQLYYVYGYAFKTIPDLIAFHSRFKKPIANGGEWILRPIAKPVWQLNHEQIEKTKKLGEGAFGEVFAGILTQGVFSPKIEVAVKQLHPGTTAISMDERIKFLREANVMLKLSHKNIIKLYGVAAANDPIMIVMEMAPGGTLLARVENKQKVPTLSDLVRYCAGAAAGMAYLESQEIIHRDIAARNCLLGKDDEAKISDFGLSLVSSSYRVDYAIKNVPLRWLAPETMRYRTYSGKSDVWSFGVMMWEVFSFGESPYGWTDDYKLLRKGVVKQTIKLSTPKGTPKDVEDVMNSCLTYNPDMRPTFAALTAKLGESRRIHCQPESFASKFRSWVA